MPSFRISGLRWLGHHADLAAFVIVAFSLPWMLWALRLPPGVVAAGGMASVGVATFVATRFWPRTRDWRRETGLRPFLPLGQMARQVGIGVGVVMGLAVAAQLLGGVFGAPALDPFGLSGARFAYGGSGPTAGLLAAALLQAGLLFVVLLPLAWCEEWGWRGFLLPRLMPLGVLPAILVGGVVWGLWHLPAYVGTDPRPGLLPFVIWCVFFGAVLSWLRMRSGTVWAATAAHAAHNTLVIGFVNVAITDESALQNINPWAHGFDGWPGWVVMTVLLGALVLRWWSTRRVGYRKSLPLSDDTLELPRRLTRGE